MRSQIEQNYLQKVEQLSKEKIYFKTDSRKIVLIFNSEALSHGSGESANMLLKVLEEPPGNTTFILVTDYIDKVMPTIKSRCQSVYVPRLTNESIEQFFAKDNLLSFGFFFDASAMLVSQFFEQNQVLYITEGL